MNTRKTTGPDPTPRLGRILLVEDNPESCKALAKLLTIQGYEVAFAVNGASALEAMRGGPPPDFVLTDLQLPDLDGREVARQARKLVPPPRVALITGWALEPESIDSEVWGIDWVFPKPLNIRDLLEKLIKYKPGGVASKPRPGDPSLGSSPA